MWNYMEISAFFRLSPMNSPLMELDFMFISCSSHDHFMSISCVYFMAISGADSSELLTIFLRPIAGGTSKQNMAAHGTVPLL